MYSIFSLFIFPTPLLEFLFTLYRLFHSYTVIHCCAMFVYSKLFLLLVCLSVCFYFSTLSSFVTLLLSCMQLCLTIAVCLYSSVGQSACLSRCPSVFFSHYFSISLFVIILDAYLLFCLVFCSFVFLLQRFLALPIASVYLAAVYVSLSILR